MCLFNPKCDGLVERFKKTWATWTISALDMNHRSSFKTSTVARWNIEKHAEYSKQLYDSKYKKSQPVYKEGDSVRIKRPLTQTALKKKLRNDNWSDPYVINKVISDHSE